MYDTICYFGLSAHDFTEISAARKERAPAAELRFFTAAAELVEHVTYSHATRILVFLDVQMLDQEWELVRRIKNDGIHSNDNVHLVLLSAAWTEGERRRADGFGLRACLRSPASPDSLQCLFAS